MNVALPIPDQTLMRRAMALSCAAMVGMWLGTITPILPQPVKAWIHAGTASLCPFPATAGVDGCAVGITFGGLVQHSNYFNGYAPVSGLPYAIRPQWSVCGVDYGCGANSSSSIDPTNNLNLPNGCTYAATGSDIGGPRVSCAGVANLTFQNFKMQTAGGVCVELIIQTTVTGSLTVHNNTFDNGSSLANSCASASAHGFFINIKTGSPLSVVNMTHNTFHGEAANVQASLSFDAVEFNTSNYASGAYQNVTLTDEYNAWDNLPGRAYGNLDATTVVSKYNYTDGLNLNGCITYNPGPPASCPTGTGEHGEYATQVGVPRGTGSISSNFLTMTGSNGAPTFALYTGATNAVGVGGTNNASTGSHVVVGGTGTLPCAGSSCIGGTYALSPSVANYASGTIAVVTNFYDQYSYNVCRNAWSSTTCFYLDTGQLFQNVLFFQQTQIDHNVITTNAPLTGLQANSTALTVVGSSSFPAQVVILDNYIDQTYSFHWSAVEDAFCTTAASFSGNMDMVANTPLTSWGSVISAPGC